MPLSLSNSTDITADVVVANLLVNSEIVTNNIRAKDADYFTVNDNLFVTGTLTANNISIQSENKNIVVNVVRAIDADQVTLDESTGTKR